MKEVNKAKAISYNAIFFSAFKALSVFELLIESPKTLDEIQERLAKIPLLNAKLSKDTLRIYLNSFQHAGCDVVKQLTQKRHREYSYYIPINPFQPVMNLKQTKRFFELYDIILYNLPFADVIELEEFTRNLNRNFRSEDFTNAYNNHSLLKDADLNMLRELEKCCQEKSIVTVLYNSPRSGHKEISIRAEKMIIQNYKVYIDGFGFEYKENAFFLISRILKITNIEPSTNIKCEATNNIEIICEIYDPSIKLTDKETLIEEIEQKRIVKHTTNNKILTTQRFLQLAENCKILAPTDFKQEFIKTLKSMNEEYVYAKQF